MTEPADLTPVIDIVARRQQLKAEIADRERDVKALDERIKDAWGPADEAFVVVAGERQRLGTWQTVESRVLDQTLLKARYPQVVADCTTTRTTRTFRLGWEPPEPPQRVMLGVDQQAVDVGPESIVTEPRYSEWDDL